MKKRLLLLSVLLIGSALTSQAWPDTPTGPEADTKGLFGPVINWPVIPIHLTLLPDGRVLSFGRNLSVPNNILAHSIWNPSLGTGTSAHEIIPNPIHTDVFCAGQTVISSTGETLITGGTARLTQQYNYSVADTNFMDPQSGTFRTDTPMQFKRWYPTLVALANGDVVILGGRDEKDLPTYASTPEIYTPGAGFRTLPGATNEDAYGKLGASWSYPRGFLAPNGKVFIVSHAGKTFWLDPTGEGAIARISTVNAPVSFPSLPSLMYAPGKILSIRSTKRAFVFDINDDTNVKMKQVAGISALRFYSSATILADGKVFLMGGSEVANKLTGVDYHTETWDPSTEQWTITASATIPRLYHSNALLMPDATVLTGGGGAPGPLKNLNAEIYYPPYLYKNDGSGLPADRPIITAAPSGLVWNQDFDVSVTSSAPIGKVTFVRAGSATHALNVDQRFMELPYSQTDAGTIHVSGPTDRNIAPPGSYMLFVFDQNGVPSVSKMIHLQD